MTAVEERAGTVRVAIVGAGFAGLGMAIRLRQAGHEDIVVFERAADAGGTWPQAGHAQGQPRATTGE